VTTLETVVETRVVETVVEVVTDAVVEAEVAGAEVAGALVGATVGMDKETPAEEQRPSAAWIVFAKSAAEQAFSTHGVKALMKAVALQIHATSVSEQPELPMLEIAQLRAHGGILPS